MPRIVGRRSARAQAEAQRARDRARRAENQLEMRFINSGVTFDDEMRAINFGICTDGCRKRTSATEIVRGKCESCRRSRVNLFSPENGMDIPSIPPELSGLSLIEQILLARVHPVVSVFKVRGQQRAYSGHCINFVQHVEQVASRLPVAPEALSCVLILNRHTPNGILQFKVRAMRIRQALLWLKRNNQYYRDIIIDEEVLAGLPEDGNIVDRLPNAGEIDHEQDPIQGDNIIDPSFFPNLPALDANEAMRRVILRQIQNPNQEIDLGDWPELDRNPADEFRSEGLICKAFPCLFPNGIGDLRAPRLHTINKHQYFRYLMQFHDKRFAKDLRFPYYAHNSLARWDALECGNAYVLRNQMQNVNAADMLEILDDPRHNLASTIMYYGSNLRGSRPYWKQRCSELIQMVKQLGQPTVFFTLSAADYHWPDLFRILAPGREVGQLDASERRNLMHDNPADVAWFFNKRCDKFMKHVMKPLFGIKDFWYRFEWQHRGSPHIHG